MGTKKERQKLNDGGALIILLVLASLVVVFTPTSSFADCTTNTTHVYIEISKLEDGFYKPMQNLTIRMVGSNNQIYVEKTDKYGAILKSVDVVNYSVEIIQRDTILKEFELSVSNCSKNYSKKIVLTDYQYNTDVGRNTGCSQQPCDVITITPVVPTTIAKSGTRGKIDLYIENKEASSRHIYITLSGPASEFFSQQQKKFYINANSIYTITIPYSIPRNVLTGDYDLEIGAQYDCYCNQTSNIIFKVKQEIPKIKLPDEGTNLYGSLICLGKQEPFVLTLTNKNFNPKTYSLSVEGIPSSWVKITPSRLTIRSYSYAKSHIILKLPQDAPEGDYNFGIRAVSQDGEEKFFSIDFTSKNCKKPTPAELFKISMPQKAEVVQGQSKNISIGIENLDKGAHTFKTYFSGISNNWISGDKIKQVNGLSKAFATFTITVPNLNLSNFTRNVGVLIKNEKNQVVFTKTLKLKIVQAQQNKSSKSKKISSGLFLFSSNKNAMYGLIFVVLLVVIGIFYYARQKGIKINFFLKNKKAPAYTDINTPKSK